MIFARIFESIFIQIHSCSYCICAICCSKLLQPAVFRDLKSYRKNRMRFNKSQCKDQTLSQLIILSLKWNVEWFEKFVFLSNATLKIPRNKPLQMAQTNGVKTQTTVLLSENLLKFFAIDLFWLDIAWFDLTRRGGTLQLANDFWSSEFYLKMMYRRSVQ